MRIAASQASTVPTTGHVAGIPNGPIYQPIEAGYAFRILLLHPAAELADEIICDLLHTRLDGASPYGALSYVWGELEPPGTVFLQGKEVRITPNLEGALRYLRHTHGVRYLWVDALCIDQANLDERSKQVQHMSEIVYLLWFGLDGSMTDDVLGAIAANGASVRALNIWIHV